MHSICKQVWKTPATELEKVSFHPSPKERQYQRMFKLLHSCTYFTCLQSIAQNSPSKNTGVGCHFLLQCMKVKSDSEVTQSCPTLGNPMDCSLLGSSIHGIFQARVLEWGAIAFSEIPLSAEETELLWMENNMAAAAAAAKSLQSCPTLCDPTDGSPSGSPSLGFSRQEHWSGLPFPSPMHESEK